jgi:hypothetical protein
MHMFRLFSITCFDVKVTSFDVKVSVAVIKREAVWTSVDYDEEDHVLRKDFFSWKSPLQRLFPHSNVERNKKTKNTLIRIITNKQNRKIVELFRSVLFRNP